MDQNEILGIKSLATSNKKQLLVRLKENLKLNWVFEKAYEKLLLLIFLSLGGWKLWELLFG